jgi:hypothetical protein
MKLAGGDNAMIFRRFVATLLVVLAPASSASAEGAWVFWMEHHSFYNVRPP